MLDIDQFRTLIVVPTLVKMELHSRAAENLLMGTAMQESTLRYIKQIGGGPALGIYQMEPATHDDIWKNYLAHRPALAAGVNLFKAAGVSDLEQLVGNLSYATAMCRVHYYRQPDPLPQYDDVAGMAAYWKKHYNTPQGKGTEAEFIERYYANLGV